MGAHSGWGSRVYKLQEQGLGGHRNSVEQKQGRGTRGGETVGSAKCQPGGLGLLHKTMGPRSPESEDRIAELESGRVKQMRQHLRCRI